MKLCCLFKPLWFACALMDFNDYKTSTHLNVIHSKPFSLELFIFDFSKSFINGPSKSPLEMRFEGRP
jgi:hypothetical protein